MQKSVYVVGLFFILCITPFALATIAVDPVQAVYNIGDDLALGFTITRATSAHGFLTAELSCSEGTSEIYKTPLRSSAGEQKRISIPVRLDRFLIGNLSQTCTIVIAYGDETARSTSFEISSETFVLASSREMEVQPGGSALIVGSATKKNGKPLEGILDASVMDLNISASTPVKGGLFNLTVPVSSRARAQTYVANLHAYDRDSEGELSNEGRTIVSFKVPQVLTTYDLALERTSISPSESMVYRILAYDQAEETIAVENTVTLIAPDGSRLINEQVRVGDLQQWNVLWNATPGIWILEAATQGKKLTKEVNVRAVQNVSVILENDTLIVRNIGNVPFSESIEVSIGGSPREVSVQLGVGESARFKLFAPEGSHDVRVHAGNSSTTFGNVFLTGKSVDVRNADSLSWNVAPWIWWMILILIAASVAIHFYRKFGRRSFWGRTSRESSPALTPLHRTHPHSTTLSSSGEGKKEECTIVALHIKNLEHLESSDSPVAAAIARASAQARNARAAVYTQGAHKIMIIAPGAVGNTRQAAVSLARDLARIFTEHNRQYAMKIVFGVGINAGQMIVETHQGKPKFTAVGTAVVSAKRLAEHAKDEVFVSDELYRSMIGKIKVEKVGDKHWKLKDQSGISRNAEFLKRFMDERA